MKESLQDSGSTDLFHSSCFPKHYMAALLVLEEWQISCGCLLSDGVPVLNAEPALESIGPHFLFQLLLFLIIWGVGGSSTV